MRNGGVGETPAELENQVCHIDPEEARREFGALGEAAQDFNTIMCRQVWVEHPNINRSEAFAKMFPRLIHNAIIKEHTKEFVLEYGWECRGVVDEGHIRRTLPMMENVLDNSEEGIDVVMSISPRPHP